MPETGLAEPPAPAALVHFPMAPPVSTLHRLSEHATAWWYSSSNPAALTGGRFDLEAPHGTCYTAESLDGALVEKLLRTGTRVVATERLGELFHAVIDLHGSLAVADLAVPEATGFGLNNEIHTTLDYRMPRRWAVALRRAGWRGLRHLLRGDPSGSTAGRALFGTTGLHRRAPTGMRTRVRQLDRSEAERLLVARHVEVRPIPAEVPLTSPDSQR